MNEKVLVTIVTYNRKELLKITLDAIFNQKKKVSGIFIFDNASTDGTDEFLKEYGAIDINEDLKDEVLVKKRYKDICMYYFKSSANLGGSGGFSKVVDISKKLENYDYLWIMDDDVKADSECLSTLLKKMKLNNVEAVVPNRNCKNYIDKPVVEFDLGSTLKYFSSKRKRRVSPPFNQDVYSVKTFAFEGPLISMNVVKKVGIPDASYFLLYDDTDYAQRILKYTEILYVVDAHMERQLPIVNEDSAIKYSWKDYYSIRNNMIFDYKYGKNWRVKYLSPKLMYLHLLVNCIRSGNFKNNFKIVKKARKDAKKNKLGKQVGPNY